MTEENADDKTLVFDIEGLHRTRHETRLEADLRIETEDGRRITTVGLQGLVPLRTIAQMAYLGDIRIDDSLPEKLSSFLDDELEDALDDLVNAEK